MSDIPVSTKWTLDAAGEIGRTSVTSVFMIISTKTQTKGTGFLLSNGYIITNEHVVRNNVSTDIMARSSFGEQITFSKLITDTERDLAILLPSTKITGGLNLGDDCKVEVGSLVSTWGFPLEYNGPSPLLSVGYLAGFKEYSSKSGIIKHLVVNGAFNPGNSGGPLFLSNDNKVIGIVSSKHAPITEFQKSALDALSNNKSGLIFTATDKQGTQTTFSESQLVADLLLHFRTLTQVMIGEAISVNELKTFLKEQSIT